MFFYFLCGICTAQNSLEINVTGLKILKGSVYIGLYDKAEGFTDLEAVYKFVIVPVKNNKAYAKIENLPNGTYALGVFHDLNNNGVLDKNFVGYPIEIYGFSNNKRAIFSAPSFASCSFELPKNQKLDIQLE